MNYQYLIYSGRLALLLIIDLSLVRKQYYLLYTIAVETWSDDNKLLSIFTLFSKVLPFPHFTDDVSLFVNVQDYLA